MIKAHSLESYTAKDLAQMAKRMGVAGWHSMRKQELIDALKTEQEKSPAKPNLKPEEITSVAATSKSRPIKPPSRSVQRAFSRAVERKDISTTTASEDADTDRVVLMVRDSYWLHAHWEIRSRSVIRAKAAMAEQWHTAQPVLRVFRTETGATSSTVEMVERDIKIHGAVTNWYIDVKDPPQSYRVEIGYLASSGKFFSIARSNSVTTPGTKSTDMADQNWVDVASQCDKILAQSGAYSSEGNDGQLQELFEERLRRPMGSPMLTRYGVGAEAILEKDDDFALEVNAELIVYGRSQADSHISLSGEPVKIRPDGTFTLRMSLPDGRQVMPIISASGDGRLQQTVILAIERNTKTMEPVARENE